MIMEDLKGVVIKDDGKQPFTDQLFKRSKQSICQNCTRLTNDCSLTIKTCHTDKKIQLAYVGKCNGFIDKNKTY